MECHHAISLEYRTEGNERGENGNFRDTALVLHCRGGLHGMAAQASLARPP